MDAALLLQYVLVAAAVLVSAGYLARRQFPQALRRLRIAVAVPMLREGRTPGWQRLGRWLAPQPRASEHACGGCHNGCGPKP